MTGAPCPDPADLDHAVRLIHEAFPGVVEVVDVADVELDDDLEMSAKRLAWHGLPVIALVPRGKRPHGGLAPHGFHDATVDLDIIERWWGRCPDANVGIAVPEHLAVVDVDPRANGLDTFAKLTAGHPDVVTLTADTGRGDGGFHLWFQRPEGKVPGTLGPGVDVKVGGSGLVVAPPSVHQSGGRYRWRNWGTVPAPPPSWFTAAVPQPDDDVERPPEYERDDDAPNILDAFDSVPWSAVWPSGWVNVTDDYVKKNNRPSPKLLGEPAELWLRPGSDSVYSVKCAPQWCQVFSTAVDGLPEGAYRKASVYAWRLGVSVGDLARELWKRAGDRREH